MLKIQFCYHKNKLDFEYYSFNCIFDQINAILVSKSDFFQK